MSSTSHSFLGELMRAEVSPEWGHILDAAGDANAWWDACRAADPTLPEFGVSRPRGGAEWFYTPPEFHAYFLACYAHRRQSLWAIALDRATRRARRSIALCRDLLSIWRGR